MAIVGGGQTSYTIDIPAISYPGQLIDNGFRDIISAVATVDVPYGMAVVAAVGSDFKKILGALPTSETDRVLGISVADQTRAQRAELALPTSIKGEALGLVREGRVAVTVESAVSFGDAVYVRYAGTGQAGALSATEVAGETVLLPGAKFLSVAIAGELAVVELEII